MVHRRLAFTAALVAASLSCAAEVSFAQEPAAAGGTTRCGGLLCDLYYAGKPAPAPGQPEAPDPTHLPCRDFLCAAFGGRTPDPAPPPVEAAAPPVSAPPVKSAKRKAKPHRTVAAAEPASAAR